MTKCKCVDVNATLDAPLEEGLAALAGPHPVVVAGCVVVTHGAEVHVGLAHRRGADHFLSVLVCLGGALLVVGRPQLVLRRPLLGVLVLGTCVATMTVLSVLGLPVLLRVSDVVAAVGAGGLLLAGGLWAARTGADVDPVTHPVAGDPSPRTTAAVRQVAPWFFLIVTLVGVGLTALLRSLT